MKATKRYRMYANPLLEALSVSGPTLMIGFHLFMAGMLIMIGYNLTNAHYSLTTTAFIFLSGMLTWTLAEYVMHRYLFHFTRPNRMVQQVHFALHGYHHQQPRDERHMFMPPVPASFLLMLFFCLFYVFMHHAAWFFLAGFEIGYLVYACIHYNVHTRKPPRILKRQWQHHMIHHYRQPQKAFGVSSRIWDRVFQTMPEEENIRN